MNGYQNSKKRKVFIGILLFSIVLVGAFAVFSSVSAQDAFGLQPVEKTIALGTTDIRTIIAKIIRAVLGLLGIIALAIVLYGGFIYMTSAGNEEKISRAKKILINGVIGLVIILSAFAIVQFVINKLSEATGIVPTVPEACADLGYANTHPEECDKDDWDTTCKENLLFCCVNNPKFFIVKSITPVTKDTKMNNVGVRAIFNQAVDGTQDMSKVLKIFRGTEDVSGKFGYAWLNDEFGEAVGVEARYKSGQETCDDGTYCLPAGNYKTEVNPDLKSKGGKTITENTSCGAFPLKASFNVFSNNQFQLSFDGKDDYVNVENKGALEKTIFLNSFGTGGITVEAWIKVLGEPNKDFPAVIEKSTGDFSDKSSAQKGFYLSAAYFSKPARNIKWGVGTAGYDAVEYSISNADLVGKWHHIAGVAEAQSAPSSKLKLYVDGKLVGETNRTYKGSIDAAVDLNIGRWREFGRYFNGLIDEARLYQRALSPEEVVSHYNNGKIKKGLASEDSLAAGWHFDEGSGAQALDYSGHNNHGDIKGAGWTEGKEEKIKDTAPPQAGALDIGGSTATDQQLPAGKIYNISSSITDNSGVGYVKMLVEKELGNGSKEKVFSYVDGPTVARGSDAPATNPYLFKYPWLIPKNVKSFERYFITLDVWDIDYNKTVISSSFIVKGEHCNNGIQDADETGVDEGGSCGKEPGEKCTDDWQCSTQKCVNGQCVAFPVITNVDPWDGAPGNWFTILGKYFGVASGKIEFGYDSNNDGLVDVQDTWTQANLAQCQSGSVWNNNWVISEVPTIMSGEKYAAKFDGITSAINIPHDNSFDFTDNFTVEGWVKWNAPPPPSALGWPGIVSKGDGTANNYYFGTFDHSREIYFTYLNSGWQDVKSDLSVKDKDWSYVAVTVSSGNINFFVDGKAATKPKPSYSLNVNDNDLLIGFSGNLTEQRFNGWISDVAIYNKALSVEDLNKHYTTGRASSVYPSTVLASQPVSYWRLDESSGTKAKNAVSGKPDGVYSAGITFGKEQGSQTFLGPAVIRLTTGDGKSVTTKDKKNVDKFFAINNIKRPGLCSVATASGAIVAQPKTEVKAIGKSFGSEKGKIYFGNTEAKFSAWSDELINVIVPNAIGKVGVYVQAKSGEKSNGVPFTVLKEGEEVQGPVISAIDPPSATPKSYITISGRNFGNAGEVWLADSASKTKSVKMNTTLPDVCGKTWTDTQVIVQVPDNAPIKKYYLTLKNDLQQETDGDDVFEVKSGNPMPGICKLGPASGPAPLPAGEKMSIYGVNFSNSPAVYFWTHKSSADNFTGWLSTSGGNIQVEANKITTPIPFYSNNDTQEYYSMQSGPIKVVAGGEKSNGVKYTVEDCRSATPEVKAKMSDNYQCCEAEGADAGRWKSKNFICAGETRGAGYVWRFTTGKIPNIPKVMEQCDQEKWETSKEYPSPIPWEKWKRGKSTCLNSTIAVKFDVVGIDKSTVNSNNVRVYKCGTGAEAKCFYNSDGKLPDASLAISKFTDGSQILVIKEEQPALEPDTWHRVILTAGIKSVPQDAGGGKTVSYPLAQTRKLAGDDSVAYYYDFKTAGANDNANNKCFLQNAYIEPPKHTTNVLGWLKNAWNPNLDFYYLLWGKGNQECSVVKADGLGWIWSSADITIAKAEVRPGNGYKDTRATAEALKESLGGVEIRAATSTSQTKETNYATSILYINLGDPQVIDYRPKCTEACINSGIGAKFNRHMKKSSYSGNVILQKCSDETCKTLLSAPALEVSNDVSDEFVLRAFLASDAALEPSTWYLVTIKKEVISLGQLNPPMDGDKLKEDFVWKFRTKDDSTPCVVSSVRIAPNPFTARMIGEKTKYSSFPFSSPDQCSSYGQELNPWGYGWGWNVADKNVADISHFQTGVALKPFCTLGCLPKGSDIALGGALPSLCGNKVVEAGEDCDLAITGEAAGVSCGLNCLRPGNKDKTTSTSTADIGKCGDGFVNTSKGEECDPGISKYCKSDCAWTGSPKTFTGDTSAPVCGKGTVTEGEECEGTLGCTENCLHTSSALSRKWCTDNAALKIDNLEVSKTAECQKAVNVCGNNQIEEGEECEIGLNGATAATCNDKCLLQNVCNTVLTQCNKGADGCKDDCTLAGSSVKYSEPSLCGDGQVGIGEHSACEFSGAQNPLGENPVQMVTAVGQGSVDSQTPSQKTKIQSTVKTYRNSKGQAEGLGANQKTGEGDYSLQCGYIEYSESVNKKYNDCPLGDNGKNNQWGVGANSCCYERGSRTSEYPVDGEGINNSGLVCRNVYIEVKFDRLIEAKTIPGNMIVAAGHDKSYNCSLNGEINVTELVKSAKLTLNSAGDAQPGIWSKIWNTLKRFFVKLFGNDALATTAVINPENYAWCSGNIKAAPAVNASSTIGETKVGLYIDDLLDAETNYAVVLKGGAKGIKDIKGVGIKSPDSDNSVDDIWFFKTGKDICKLKSVSIEPPSHLFDKPFTNFNFDAKTESENGQQIVSTPAYQWEWRWSPVNHPVFVIPAEGASASAPSTIIGAKNIEGSLAAVVQAKVTKDISALNNHTNKVFTGATNLTAKFCENPWPARSTSTIPATWQPFEDITYNYSFSYCADVGKSGNTADDLPFLQMNEIKDPNVLKEDVLKKVMFFNDKNDDVVGLQIFQNPQRLSASEWFKNKFKGVKVQPMNIAGYDAIVVDNENYYINALNVTDTSTSNPIVYNNIYLFSINKGAQTDTRKVLEQIMAFLEFNINITDYGYCLNETGNIFGSPADYNDDLPCENDFACHDSQGIVKSGTNGVCSNAKTKLFRDWNKRLPDIKSMQAKLGATKGNYPKLASGTYIPGYTVSRWPSWGKIGSQVGGFPIDLINNWAGCDAKADQQTCWDAASSTYSCPQFASVYEYEFVSSTGKYKLHAPLEYFAENSNIVKEFIDPVFFTTSRWCTPLQKYSPFGIGEKCGDGIVNIAGEECDPPGKTLTSDKGLTPATPGVCQYKKTKQCANAMVDCGKCFLHSDLNKYFCMNGNYYCAENLDLVINPTPSQQLGGDYTLFSCDQDSECRNIDTFSPADSIQIGTGATAPTYSKTEFEKKDLTNFYCIKNSTFTQSAAVSNCEGYVPVNLDVCADGKKADKYCNSACKWEYGICKSISVCGNGKVETGEVCDDGTTLNGTYGHCAGPNSPGVSACQGLHPQYCGNQQLDTDAWGKPLEFCDKAEAKYQSGFCLKAKVSSCDKDEDCKISFIGLDSGPCQSTGEPTYDFKKENSCSWDCQSYGGYCGDGKAESIYEECDDGNVNNNDGCKNDCTPNVQPAVCGNGIKEAGEECDDGNKNDIDGCSNACKLVKAGYCGNGITETYKDKDGNDFVEKCDKGTDNGEKCEPTYDKSCAYCSVDCKKVLTVDPAAYCGDGKAQYAYEKCDILKLYSLTFVVSSTLKKSEEGEIVACNDKGEYKCLDNCQKLINNCVECGKKSVAQGGASPKIALLNPMIGKDVFWPYENDEYSGLFRTNKTGGKTVSITYIDLFKQIMNNAVGDSGPPTAQHYFYSGSNQKAADIKTGIENNLLCKDEYALFLNHDQLNKALQKSFSDTELWQNGYGDIFPYPVKGDANVVENELIISPAVPPGVFRVVVRWTDKENDKGAVFTGLTYSDQLASTTPFTEDLAVSYMKVQQDAEKKLCKEMGPDINNSYWEPKVGSCDVFFAGNQPIFVHDLLNLQKTFIQSFTIDTRPFDSNNTKPIAFFVQNINGFIADFQNSNLQVEVYTSQPDQIPKYSVYAPTYTFPIQNVAGTSSNPLAKYWHVFNLMRIGSDYVVELVGKIETDFCQVLKNMPDTGHCSL